MKESAFYLEDGEWKIIGAEELEKRRACDPHTWCAENREYYSTNSSPDRRLKMHLKRNGDSVFFAFNRGQDEAYSRLGKGEGVGHYIYKTAISELKGTTLQLWGKYTDIKMTITSAEVEHCIQLSDRKYFIDVFLTFESKSAYMERWKGCVGIEVHKTNAVDIIKEADMKALDIPLVEVDVNEKLLGSIGKNEASASNEDVRKQIEYIKKRFTENLRVKIKSDPESDEFTKNENFKLKKQLKETKSTVETLKNDLSRVLLTSKQKDQKLDTVLIQLDKERLHRENLSQEVVSINQELRNIKSMSVTRFIKFKLFGS